LLCLAAGLAVLAILALILVTTTNEAWPALRDSGIGFFTDNNWIPNDPDGPTGPRTAEFGALAFVYGTFVVSAVALLIAVPLSIGIALFTTELASRRLRGPIVTVIDLLAAIPSVVFGLWGLFVVAPGMEPLYDWVHERVDGIPILGSLLGAPVSSGKSFMTAGVILAIMITPIITSIAREVFDTVPEEEKHAALALGATRWEMIKGAVFPHSFGGLVGAVMLGLGRAMGETIAVALTVGASVQIVANLFQAGDAMPAVIVRNFGESSGTYRAALIGLGVVLFAMTVAVNLLARPSGPTGGVPALTYGSLTRSSQSTRRRFTNRLTTLLMLGSFAVALVPLGLVCYYVVSKGIGIIGWDWFTEDIPRQQRVFGPGMKPAIVGTLVITGAATLLAVPLGVLGAVYLSEYGKQRPLARLIRTMSDVMTGVPSIVMGLFIYVVWVLRTEEQSGLAAAFALASLMLPIVIRSTEEILRLVPDELRQASLALGARRWRMILTVVLPAALSGITSGALLAVARAAGETAPLIVTAGTIFNTNWSLDGPNTALTAQIFRNANSVFPAAHERAWGAALTLVVIVLLFTLIARLIANRFTVKER
jgi:phosphate ABC transporter permease subunit PstA/phosphate ABC transporter permease protein PstC